MQWDYIIVGAGSAGCALAYELAKAGRKSILVLEAGGSDSSPYIRVPAGQVRAIKSNDWGYVSQADPTRGGRVEPWERGRVLGGSSSINGMMFVRGAPADYDRWASLGNRGWSYNDVLPIFREMECSDQLSPLRGRNGPLAVTTVRRPHALTDAFIRTAQAAGIPFNADYNSETQFGVGYAQLSQRHGLRSSSSGAFLKPLLGRKNLKLQLKCLVERIDIERGRATRVSYTVNGRSDSASGRQIIVCAGAINSPKLLMLSGIGDPDELMSLGIPVQIARSAVGRGLREHPLLKLTYRTNVQSNNLTGGLRQKALIGLQYLARQSGPIAHIFEAAAFLRTRPTEPIPDIQLHFLSFGLGTGTGSDELPVNYPSVTVLMNKSYPKSSGRIRLASKDSAAAPLIECRLLECDEDLNTLVRGVGTVRSIMKMRPMADLVIDETIPGDDLVSEDGIRQYIRANTEIAYHPSCTCRMGIDEEAVVTPELLVRGTENLWIADASVMPDLISGNTNAVCMMVGMKLGRYLNKLAEGAVIPSQLRSVGIV